MSRNASLRIPHPVVFAQPQARPFADGVELLLRDPRWQPDPFENPRWEVSLRPDDLEDEEDD